MTSLKNDKDNKEEEGQIALSLSVFMLIHGQMSAGGSFRPKPNFSRSSPSYFPQPSFSFFFLSFFWRPNGNIGKTPETGHSGCIKWENSIPIQFVIYGYYHHR
jgi:hypothetical protein